MAVRPNFGDRAYKSAELIPRIVHYPKYTTTTPFQDALQSTYFHAQHHSRLILSQPYGYDLRDAYGDSSGVQRAFTQNSWVGIARGRRNLPEEINLIKANIGVAVWGIGATTFYARITIDNGVASDTNSNSRSIDSAAADSSTRADFPFTSGHAPFLHEVSVELSNINIASPGRVRITVDAYALRDVDSSAVAVQPLLVTVLGEMVYPEP